MLQQKHNQLELERYWYWSTAQYLPVSGDIFIGCCHT